MPWSVLGGRVVAPGEPLWTQEDTDLALALTEIESVRCSGCGNDLTETLDDADEFAWQAEAVRCHACAARDRAARKAEDMDTSGLRWLATRRTDGGD